METRVTKITPVTLAVPLDQPTRLPVGNWNVRRNLVVVVETDDGTRGYGEAWVNFPAWGCQDRVAVLSQVIRPLLVGEPLDDPRRLYEMMVHRTAPLARRWHALGPVSHAIAATDIALWDAFARRAGLSLKDAIAGRPVDGTVKVYASGIGPDLVAESIERARRDGHERFKLRLVMGAAHDSKVLHAAREAAGAREIMADPAETYTPRSIGEIWQNLLDCRVSWLEEPFPTDCPEMYEELRRWSPRPMLALGESSYGADGLANLIDRDSPEVVQPDITKTGGITGGMEFARICAERGRKFVPHMLAGPIGFLASAHLVAAVGAEMVEMDYAPVATFADMAGGVPLVSDGQIALGEDNGHGAIIDEEKLSRWIEG